MWFMVWRWCWQEDMRPSWKWKGWRYSGFHREWPNYQRVSSGWMIWRQSWSWCSQFHSWNKDVFVTTIIIIAFLVWKPSLTETPTKCIKSLSQRLFKYPMSTLLWVIIVATYLLHMWEYCKLESPTNWHFPAFFRNSSILCHDNCVSQYVGGTH